MLLTINIKATTQAMEGILDSSDIQECTALCDQTQTAGEISDSSDVQESAAAHGINSDRKRAGKSTCAGKSTRTGKSTCAGKSTRADKSTRTDNSKGRSAIENCITRNMKYLRKSNGLTQQSLANALHIDRSSYSRLENGASSLSVTFTRRLAEFYRVDYGRLTSVDMQGRPCLQHGSPATDE